MNLVISTKLITQDDAPENCLVKDSARMVQGPFCHGVVEPHPDHGQSKATSSEKLHTFATPRARNPGNPKSAFQSLKSAVFGTQKRNWKVNLIVLKSLKSLENCLKKTIHWLFKAFFWGVKRHFSDFEMHFSDFQDFRPFMVPGGSQAYI